MKAFSGIAFVVFEFKMKAFLSLPCCFLNYWALVFQVICVFVNDMQYDQDYHPGRRKRGKDYKEGMV